MELRDIFKDWLPWVVFLILFSNWVSLKNMIPYFNQKVRFDLPFIEQSIFGFSVVLWFQNNRIFLLDWVGNYIRLLHLIVPTITVFILYRWGKNLFRKFTYTLILTTYVSLVIFLFLPQAPPWLAYKETLNSINNLPYFIRIFYGFLQGDPYAPFPSLHAAFPIICTVYLFKLNHKIGFLGIIYSVLVWISSVYTADHYLIDIFAGIGLSLLIFYIVERWDKIKKYWAWKFTQIKFKPIWDKNK